MEKLLIFYFVHAHGNGHRATFNLLYCEFSVFFKVIAISTNSEVTKYLKEKHNVEVLELPPKYPEDFEIPEHTFSKAFEATPYFFEAASRAKAFAEAILKFRPKVLYCDGVPELAIVARAMGLPVVLVHLHGNIMQDPTQIFAHELADHIVAHFPEVVEQKDFPFASKTFYSGYLSKYSETKPKEKTENQHVTVLLGYDNYDEKIIRNVTADQNIQFTIIGNKIDYNLRENCLQLGRVTDISAAIKGKTVISAAGQNTVAELLSLKKNLILLPEPRPYDEQVIHAKMLAEKSIALLADENFTVSQWSEILRKAQNIDVLKENLVNTNGPKEIAKKMKKWYA